MPERVAQVERDPSATRPPLPLIGDDDFDLRPRAAFDEFRHVAVLDRIGLAGSDRLAMALEQLEQPLVAERRHLHRLTEGGPPLPLGQGGEDADIDDDRGRLVERAHEVLALGQVDRGLAADRRVDLGDERRRDVHDRDPTQVRRREEAGGIAERPATDGDHRLVAFHPEPAPARLPRSRGPTGAWPPRPREASRSRPSSRPRQARRQGAPPRPPTPRAPTRGSRAAPPADAASPRRPSPRCRHPARSGRSAWRRATAWSGGRRSSSLRSARCRSTRRHDLLDLRRRPRRGRRPRRRSVRVAAARSRSVPMGSRPVTSGRTCGERRSRWARTSGRLSSQTLNRPRYSPHRLRGSTTAPPPVATMRRSSGSGSGGPRSVTARRSRRRNAASPSSSKMRGIGRPSSCSIALVEIDERGAVPVGQALAHHALAAPGQPDQHDVHRRDLVVAARAGFVRPGQSMGRFSGVRPGAPPDRRPPATGASGARSIRAR